jgi:hypothetical protein
MGRLAIVSVGYGFGWMIKRTERPKTESASVTGKRISDLTPPTFRAVRTAIALDQLRVRGHDAPDISADPAEKPIDRRYPS